MIELWSEGLRRGDECHNRNVASSAAVLARLAPAIVAAADRRDAVDVLAYMAANPHFFLALSIAAAKALSDVVHRTGDPGVVTAMSSNGASLGIRVSGVGDRWFLADSLIGDAKLFEGYEPADASPVLGDSFIAETVGLGAFALSASPAIVSFVGGDPLTVSATVEELRGICRGTSSRFLIPAEGFRGTPIGIDVHKVATTGIAPPRQRRAGAPRAGTRPGRGLPAAPALAALRRGGRLPRRLAFPAVDAHYTRVVGGRVVPVPGEWVIDGLHSSVAFAARHLLTTMRGRFREVSGTVTIDEDPQRSRAEVQIVAASIDTAHPKADEHLRGPLFLDVERYPALTFSGSGACPAGADLWNVAGDLTCAGRDPAAGVVDPVPRCCASPAPAGGEDVLRSQSESPAR